MFWFKRAGQVLLVGLALGALALTVVYGFVEWQMRRPVTLPPQAALRVSLDSVSVARGQHLATAVAGCTGCHGEDLGGRTIVDVPLVMRLTPSNLTTGEGGMLSRYDDAALEAAVRHGVAANGRPLRFMPSHEFSDLADDHVAALIAYLRTRPPVDRRMPPTSIGPIARILAVTGKLVLIPYDRIDHARPHVARAPEGVSAEHGRYLAQGCKGCHGPQLSGGRIPGAPPDFPPARNITPTGIGTWSDQDFVRAIRTGQRPNGAAISTRMPWKDYAHMTDDELLSIRRYLATVPARATGLR
ncbi:MAG: c-type cytochrome [Gemmatimonadaceae bacterium]|nr:c-type cytochrome [Gemmatimonadaceae bacterium]